MAAGSAAAAASVRSLTIELMSLQKEPVEGFTVSLENEDDMYLWRVAIFGPPDTPYEGGYFKVATSVHFNLSLLFITYRH